ncbi:MAG: cupin [Pseudomonadota bacterium]
MPLQPQHTYVHLAETGAATELPAEDFWSTLAASGAYDGGWLISEYAFTQDWPNWEMHPEGDEFVYLLAGALDLLIEKDGQVSTISLSGSGAAVVPSGLWHTAKVREPSRMLHVTRGAGTQHRDA